MSYNYTLRAGHAFKVIKNHLDTLHHLKIDDTNTGYPVFAGDLVTKDEDGLYRMQTGISVGRIHIPDDCLELVTEDQHLTLI